MKMGDIPVKSESKCVTIAWHFWVCVLEVGVVEDKYK